MERKSKGGPDYIKYNDTMPTRAHRLALLGATNNDMAIVLGVNIGTIEYWIRTKPEFTKAVNSGKMEADSEVAESIFKRAIGFTIKETKLFLFQGKVIEHVVDKYYPPDSWAAARILALRQRGNWTEIQKIENTQTNINITKIDITGLNIEELKLAKKLGLKQLTENAGHN